MNSLSSGRARARSLPASDGHGTFTAQPVTWIQTRRVCDVTSVLFASARTTSVSSSFVPAGAHVIAAVLQRPTAASPANAGSAIPSPVRSIRFWIAMVAVSPLPTSDPPVST